MPKEKKKDSLATYYEMTTGSELHLKEGSQERPKGKEEDYDAGLHQRWINIMINFSIILTPAN